MSKGEVTNMSSPKMAAPIGMKKGAVSYFDAYQMIAK
jgi:hypothetical protein